MVKSKPMGDCQFFEANNLENRAVLKAVTRGVYVMQSVQECGLFRFGQFGTRKPRDASDENRNNAADRLGQCSRTWRIASNKEKSTFRFLILCQLPGMDVKQVTAIEEALREKLLGRFGCYKNDLSVKRYKDKKKGVPRTLAWPKDAFVACDAEEVSKIARKCIESFL